MSIVQKRSINKDFYRKLLAVENKHLLSVESFYGEDTDLVYLDLNMAHDKYRIQLFIKDFARICGIMRVKGSHIFYQELRDVILEYAETYFCLPENWKERTVNQKLCCNMLSDLDFRKLNMSKELRQLLENIFTQKYLYQE